MGLELAPQSADVHLHQVGVVRVVAPHPVQDLGGGDDPAPLLHEEGQHAQLGGGQVEPVAVARGDPGAEVQRNVAHLNHLRQPSAPAQHRADPRHQLGQLERLDDVVVGTAVEAAQPVRQPVASGDQDDSDVAPFADDIDEREPVAARQHHVEHHEIGPHAVEHRFQPAAVAAGVGVIADIGERLADHLPDGL